MMLKITRNAILAGALASVAGMASAAGTAPGIDVNNSLDLSYTSGGQTISENDAASVNFKVDRKVDFLIEGQDAGNLVTVEQGSDEEQLTFRLENEGNDVSGYDIDVASSGAIGLTYDASGGGAVGTYSVYVGTSAGPLDTTAGDTLYDVTGTINLGDVVADGERFIKIVANIPGSASDGQTDSFDVTATALDAGTSTITTETASPAINVVDTILADPAEDGLELASEDFRVTAPVLSATKSSVVASENRDGSFDCANDPVDASAAAYVPGGCVEYTITVNNAGSASTDAVNLTITDTLPADVTFTAISANTGFDTVSESGGTITADIASLPAGSSAEVKVRVTIN